MYRSRSFRLLVALLALLCASHAAAQKPRDKAANKKIDEAINQQYLTTNFDKAEGILIGTINACDDKCSPPVLARAWMYLGIVRGSGKNDTAGAQEAFAQALALDPGVKLDAELATAKTVRAFEAAGGTAPHKEAETPAATSAGGNGGLNCTPAARQIQTRYPVPISCAASNDAAKVELFYAASGGQWKALHMKKKDGAYQALVPCAETQSPGTLQVYVSARGKRGEALSSWGSKSQPVEFTISTESGEAPPAFPNQDPVERCAESEECPPDFPGCKTGAAKPRSSTGTCQSDADCSAGSCVDGVCRVEAKSSSFKKNWFGIHAAHDWAFVGGSDVCSRDSQAHNGFVCYYEGTENLYTGNPQPGNADNVERSGFVSSTSRFLVSYDRAFSTQFMLGLRGGYAIGGGPPAASGTHFLPAHVEVRGTFFPLKNSLAKKGFRPYVQLGGGMAQVDAKVSVEAVDCSTDSAGNPNPADETECATNRNAGGDHPKIKLDSYKKLGQGFVAFGGGALFAVTDNLAFQLNLSGMFMLPSSGAVVQPSAGLLVGF